MSSNLKPPTKGYPLPLPTPVAKPPHPRASDPIIPKVWITKYALTKGVYTAENVVQRRSITDQMIEIQYKTSTGYMSHFCIHKPYWHTTEDEARAQVVKMVERKMKSLIKSKHHLNKVLASVEGSVPSKPWA